MNERVNEQMNTGADTPEAERSGMRAQNATIQGRVRVEFLAASRWKLTLSSMRGKGFQGQNTDALVSSSLPKLPPDSQTPKHQADLVPHMRKGINMERELRYSH